MSKKLRLTFGTDGGSKSSLSVEDPKDGLDDETVRAAMETIINSEVFENKNGEKYDKIAKAAVIETNEITLI